MTISDIVIQNIIRNLLLNGANYRVEVVNLLDAEFLGYAMEFFKKVAEAKLKDELITQDWYKETLLDKNLPADEIAINSGINKKTITNIYHSARKEIVIDASYEHYDALHGLIQKIADEEDHLGLTLTIKVKKVSVELSIGESMVVINSLAVKRAQLRGGVWSSAGKRVEKPLMLTLCKLYNVAKEYYSVTGDSIERDQREVDFYILQGGQRYRCEVKLMGKGNPESADSVFPRLSQIFVADKLSQLNKDQLNSANIFWIELSATNGYRKFGTILNYLNVPYEEPPAEIDNKLDEVLRDIF